MTDLTAQGGMELVRNMRAGTVSPLEVMDAHIARIEAVEPRINALVIPCFGQAREEARRATERYAGGRRDDLPPLLGLPITVKDALAVGSVRFTAGSRRHAGRVAAGDAEAVRRMRAAGAIVLGKTNCAEMSASVETDNAVFGRTRNPWDLRQSAGGSSGGEGALIAAGGSPLGIGSDIAGSIRIPSALCGVIGLKPTPGRVPVDGHEPAAPAAMASWNCVGPMARRVEDLAAAFAVLSGGPVQPFGTIALKGRRVIAPEPLPLPSARKNIRTGVQNAAGALAGAGMAVTRDIRLPLMRAALECAAVMHREWLPQLRRDLGGERPVSILREIAARWLGRNRTVSAVLAGMTALSAAGPFLRLTGYPHQGGLERIREEMLAAMGPGGLLIWPAFPSPAPRHGFAWTTRGLPFYTGIFNALGFPAAVLPVGMSAEGLPLNAQIIGPPGEDETVLAAAAVVERAFGGWRRAPMDE